MAYDNLGSLISSLDIYSEANLCILSHFSHVQLFETPWTVACQAPLSMGISRPENWGGLTFSSPGDLSAVGIEPNSLYLHWQVGFLPLLPAGKQTSSHVFIIIIKHYIYKCINVV